MLEQSYYAFQRVYPASIRLLDNDQLMFGMAIKPEKSLFESIVDKVKQVYVTKLRGFKPHKMSICTLVFEGSAEVCFPYFLYFSQKHLSRKLETRLVIIEFAGYISWQLFLRRL